MLFNVVQCSKLNCSFIQLFIYSIVQMFNVVQCCSMLFKVRSSIAQLFIYSIVHLFNCSNVQCCPWFEVQLIKCALIYYFLPDCHKINPPTPITAMPINGDQVRLCFLFAVISILPISTTFSLVK